MFKFYAIQIELDAIDENGNTALHLAAKKSDSLQIVKTLVELGCSKSLKNDSGLTPISIAEIEAQIEKDPEKAAKFSAIVKVWRRILVGELSCFTIRP